MGLSNQGGVVGGRSTTIRSDTVLPDVSQHFRITAGPGAGKTHWLTCHIRHIVAAKSLGTSQRVACISYTNIAATEVIERLGNVAWQVDASTIHSFLYRHLVRHYLWLLRDVNGAPLVKFSAVDGHQEHRPSRRLVEAWLRSASPQKGAYLVNELLNKNAPETIEYLGAVRWQYDAETATWTVAPPRRAPPQFLPVKRLDSYKAHYWREGIIDHDDVLYFSHRLLGEHPALRGFLAARFPFIFIDEFQDTNPVQMTLVRWLAEAGSVVGVVGDGEQAIFGFQGASRDAFLNFDLPAHCEYRIEDNRRSSNQIVRILNHLRADGLHQSPSRGWNGPAVQLLVGAPLKSVEMCEQLGAPVVVLARTNAEVAALRARDSAVENDPWDDFRALDSSSGRPAFWERLLLSCELARGRRLGESVATLASAIRRRDGSPRSPFNSPQNVASVQCDGVALSIIECLLRDFDGILGQTLLNAYSLVTDAATRSLPGLTLKKYGAGKPKEFASRTVVRTLLAAILLEDETRGYRTIHKAKSSEFDNVLVCLKGEDCLDHVLFPRHAVSEKDQEERRVVYVALSRARDRLTLAVPSLSSERESALAAIGIQVTRLP